jgi:hypothetical protein
MSSIFDNEESISVKLFNLPPKAAFTSYSPLSFLLTNLTLGNGVLGTTLRTGLPKETLTSNWIWLNPLALAAYGGCMFFIQSG